MKGCERSELLCPGKRIGLLLHKTAGRGGIAAPARTVYCTLFCQDRSELVRLAVAVFLQ